MLCRYKSNGTRKPDIKKRKKVGLTAKIENMSQMAFSERQLLIRQPKIKLQIGNKIQI